jgi:large subunit ribosomal protein L6
MSSNQFKLALAGTEKSLKANAAIGLTTGFSKTLEIVGTGYKALPKDNGLELFLGFSHAVKFSPPPGITVTVKDNRLITVAGADKYLVGQTAANLRALRPPDAYKGKGIRYQGETIKLKPGKAAKAAGES